MGKPASRFYPVTRKEMEGVLFPMKFHLLNPPGSESTWPRDIVQHNVRELVYGCRARPISDRLTVRVYSGISMSSSQSRVPGDDAIRVQLVWLDIDPYEDGTSPYPIVRIVGTSKRVHRIQTWESNLRQRISDWQSMKSDRRCPVCNAPMAERENSKTKKSFLGCCRYPECTQTLPF